MNVSFHPNNAVVALALVHAALPGADTDRPEVAPGQNNEYNTLLRAHVLYSYIRL